MLRKSLSVFRHQPIAAGSVGLWVGLARVGKALWLQFAERSAATVDQFDQVIRLRSKPGKAAPCERAQGLIELSGTAIEIRRHKRNAFSRKSGSVG